MCTLCACNHYSSPLPTSSPSRYFILASAMVANLVKYALFMIDSCMDGQWESKAVYVFYLELVRDLLHLLVYFAFFTIVFM